MTEPDEALIWARERAKADWLESSDEVGVLHTAAEDFPSGDSDHFEDVAWRAEAYRAGQAASAERIKALEGELAIWNTEFPASRLRTIKEKGEESIATKINAARLEGIRLGLEAAAREADKGSDRLDGEWREGCKTDNHLAGRSDGMDEAAELIRALDPATIAREVVLDKLASEAQEQGMGYDPNVRYGVKVVRPRMFAALTAKEADQ
jgi:hypothetical protein